MMINKKVATIAMALLIVSPAYSAQRASSVEMARQVATLSEQTAVMSGQVSDPEGKPIRGVMVRLGDDGMGMAESVFTDAQGNYTLKTQLNGNLYLRLRAPYYRDYREVVTLDPAAPAQKNFVLEPMTGAAEISESLPAAYHFATLPFETGENARYSRDMFQRDCLSCHQIGNPYTRTTKTEQVWKDTITRMHTYVGNFDMALVPERAAILAKGFNEDTKPLTIRPVFPLDKALNNAKIYEYRLAPAYIPHDTIYNPNDGLLYTVDQGLDYVSVTDMASGKTEYVFQADGLAALYRHGTDDGDPLYKEFPKGLKHGPHSLAMGLDKKYYITNGSVSIGVFDPKTRRFEASYKIPEDTGAVYPHTIRVDGEGMVWFSLTGSEQLARLDPTSGEFKILNLPTHKPMGFAGTTQPYGVAVHPLDGTIWYSRLYADKIGRIDPKTLEITEFDSPMGGPRRMHFDKKGVLWITGYEKGTLARIEVGDKLKSKVYPLPGFAEGVRPAAYALGVHPETQEIWINENMTDRIYRFIPSEERFIAYPMPLMGTYTRDMTFTKEGKVCTSNNPVPPMALEGGVLEIICIDPNYSP
jgi:streptogramin lyase